MELPPTCACCCLLPGVSSSVSPLLCHLTRDFQGPVKKIFFFHNSPFDVCMLICGIALIPFLASLLRPPSSSSSSCSSGCLWRWVMTAWFSRPRPQLPACLPACRWVEASGAHQERTSGQNTIRAQKTRALVASVGIFIWVFFFLLGPKKVRACVFVFLTHTHTDFLVFRHIWPTLIFTATASRRFPPPHPPSLCPWTRSCAASCSRAPSRRGVM